MAKKEGWELPDGFPVGDANEPQTADQTGGAEGGTVEANQENWFYKSGFIKKTIDIWPDVEKHIRHMGENGLREAAYRKEDGKAGEYEINRALAFAKKKGWLKDDGDAPVHPVNHLEAINRRKIFPGK